MSCRILVCFYLSCLDTCLLLLELFGYLSAFTWAVWILVCFYLSCLDTCLLLLELFGFQVLVCSVCSCDADYLLLQKNGKKKRNIIYEHAFYVTKHICALLHFTYIWLMIEIRGSQNQIKEELGDSVLSPDSKLAADLLMQKSEPGSLPVKKKRNSYADSPHKLNCPHCPRSFPWVSSLNRHMLTHTGKMKRIYFCFIFGIYLVFVGHI